MKNTKGITLVALVITIIVLLILAGVALSALTGNDNIIKNAETAVEGYNSQKEAEETVLNTIAGYLEQHMTGGGNNPPTTGKLTPLTGTAEVDSNGLATKKTLIKPDANDDLQIVIPEGFAPVILNGSNSTTSGPGEDGSVKSIMPADQWKNITTEQINKGIVIVDHAITYDNGQATGTVPDFNEFVWVPIPESNKFARTAWLNIRQYGTTSSSPKMQILAEEETEGAFWEETDTVEYTGMVASVNEHKGFYIGRYEASANGTIAQSKRNAIVWTSNEPENIMTACSAYNYTSNVHLMYGVEWDSTLNWMKDNAIIVDKIPGDNSNNEEVATKIMEEQDIIFDYANGASLWGNIASDAGPEPAGSNEEWKANNIYNFLGNLIEITQEKYKGYGIYNVARGGSWYAIAFGGASARWELDLTFANGYTDVKRI